MRHTYLLVSLLVSSLFCLSLSALAAESPHVMHGAGRPVAIADIVPGRFHSELAALPPEAQAKALAWLSRMRFHDHDVADLHADAQGGIFFACSNAVTAAPKATTVNAVPGVARAAVLLANQPSYHSKPGATNRIYLDFNGATVTGTAWNGGSIPATLVCPPLDIDSTPTTFNDAEQKIILEVWQRVAEDYAPYNVDVTTDPALESSLNNNTGHVVITNSSIGVAPGAGGVAYVGVFGGNNYASFYAPAFVFFDKLGPNQADYIAEAAAHEMGHNLGLSHDTITTKTKGYYGGHGSGATSWGPIMGTGYDRNVSQFSKGEYYQAYTNNGNTNNGTPATLEDDLSIIASFLTYRADDYGNTNGTATDISAATFNVSGIIGKTNDVDVLSFRCRAGAVTLTANSWKSPEHTNGGNLDIQMRLYDVNGVLVLPVAAPSGDTKALIATTLTAGTYYVHISNDGDGNPFLNSPTGYTSYGSLGQWTLTGTSVVTTATITATDAVAAESGSDTGAFTVSVSATSPSPTTVAYTSSGTAINGSDFTTLPLSVTIPPNASSATITVSPIDDALVEGLENVTLTLVTNVDYVAGSAKQATITITDNDLPTVSITATDAQASEAGGNTGTCTVSLSTPVAQNTMVNFQLSGTTINGADYSALGTAVTIPANASSAIITVSPLSDELIEGSEAVTVTLAGGTGYRLSTATAATVTIADATVPPPPPASESDGSKCGLGGIGVVLLLSMLRLALRRRDLVVE